MKNILRASDRKNSTYLVMFLLCFLSSCGSKDSAVSTGEIVAKVDGIAISKQQLSNSIDAAGPLTAEQRVALSSQVLEQLIDQVLIARKAVEGKLEQDAVVASSLENARIQVLSHHYIERIVDGAEKPSAADVKKYYSENPYLFEKRRVYRFQEFSAEVNDDQMKTLQAELGKSRNLNDAAKWMRSQNIPFTGDIVLRAAEQLPLEDLQRIYGMKVGEIAVSPRGRQVLVFQLVAIQEAPISAADAAPLIERLMINRRRVEIRAEETRKLRAGVKIEYVGGNPKK
jgi:EpsD family peptidyl-prolyl cis-trans isomerase